LAFKDRMVLRVSQACLVFPAKTAAMVLLESKALTASPEPTEAAAKIRLMVLKGLMVPMEKQATMVPTETRARRDLRDLMAKGARKAKREPTALSDLMVFPASLVSLESQAPKVHLAPLANQAKMETMVKRATRDLMVVMDYLGHTANLALTAAQEQEDLSATKGPKEAKESKVTKAVSERLVKLASMAISAFLDFAASQQPMAVLAPMEVLDLMVIHRGPASAEIA